MSEQLDKLIIQKEVGLGARNPGLQLLHYKRPGADGAYQVEDDLLSRLNVIRQKWDDNQCNEHWIAAGGSNCAPDCPCCAVDAALLIGEPHDPSMDSDDPASMPGAYAQPNHAPLSA